MNEKQTNYTIAESCTLPSNGLIYDTQLNTTIELRSMTARDEMKRLAPSANPLKTLSDIIEGCCIETPKVHVYDMAFADYEFLLHRLRTVTYGADYAMSLTCPHCESDFDTTTSLDALEIKGLTDEEWEKVHNVILPKNGDKITLKVLTPRMMEAAQTKAKELKKKFKDANLNFEMLTGLMESIDYVNDKKLTTIQLQNYIDRLTAIDFQKLQNARDAINNSFGITNIVTVTCPICGEEVTTFFRFGSEFFRPSNI